MKWRDPTVSIWDEALELLGRADRLHRQFFQFQHYRTGEPTWAPPADMFETEQGLVIIVALPGVAADQLLVSISNGEVIVRGQRFMPIPRETARIRRLEIPYGQFERHIELPPGQFQNGQHVLKDGCLVLTLQKIG